MPKRKIITINEKKCNGCGLCIPNCPEGAIQIINNKARLVSDLFCDGLGACLGNCPQGAISIEERYAREYNERQVIENISKQGIAAIEAHLKHLKKHNQEGYYQEALSYLEENNIDVDMKNNEKKSHCGCPSIKEINLRKESKTDRNSGVETKSELSQWPLELHLLNPYAEYFKNADLLFAADCAGFAYPDFHRRFLKGKILIIFCPKLDNATQVYTEKLSAIIQNNNIKSITLVHMEVPCCFGLVSIAEAALKDSGKNIIMKEYTIGINGKII